MSAQTCPSCLSAKYEGGRCAQCGFTAAEYTAPRTALPVGSAVGAYRLGVMKTSSRQSQIYTGVHTETSAPVIIEEFFPARVAARTPGNPAVAVNPKDETAAERFQQACLLLEASDQKRPLERAETLRENDTVYSVFKPKAGVPLAVQCEALADSPVVFRDAGGMPQMTINALAIPPMPAERPFNPDQLKEKDGQTPEAAAVEETFVNTPVSEIVIQENRKKVTRWVILAAAVVLLGLLAGLFFGPLGEFLHLGASSTNTPASVEVSPPASSPATVPTETPIPEPTETPTPEPTAVPLTESEVIAAAEFRNMLRARVRGSKPVTCWKLKDGKKKYDHTSFDRNDTVDAVPGEKYNVTVFQKKDNSWFGEYREDNESILATLIQIGGQSYQAKLGTVERFDDDGSSRYQESDFKLLFDSWDPEFTTEELTLELKQWDDLYNRLEEKKKDKKELQLKREDEQIKLVVKNNGTVEKDYQVTVLKQEEKEKTPDPIGDEASTTGTRTGGSMTILDTYTDPPTQRPAPTGGIGGGGGGGDDELPPEIPPVEEQKKTLERIK